MNKIILLFVIIIISIFFYKYNFDSIDNFKPFYYGRINTPSDYYSRNNYPTYFKMGEIDVNIGPNKNYDKYLNSLHNKHMNERISNFNYSCPCQKLNN
jgi:hypothetical protein